MKVCKEQHILKDTWHLSNTLHNYLLDYEDLLLSKGFDPMIIKTLKDKLEDLGKEL